MNCTKLICSPLSAEDRHLGRKHLHAKAVFYQHPLVELPRNGEEVDARGGQVGREAPLPPTREAFPGQVGRVSELLLSLQD